MNISSRYRSVCLSIGPAVIATWAIAAPAQAAAFSSALGSFQIDFWSSPLDIETATLTDSEAISGDGIADASSDADIDFFIEPAGGLIEASGESVVTGSGNGFSSFSEGQAIASGIFELDAGETFAFDFSGSLMLKTSIDDPEQESAFASGEFGLLLLNESDPGAEQEFLQIFTFLETLGNEPEPFVDSQGNFNLTLLNVTQSLGGLEESTSINFEGTYSQKFDRATTFRLQEAGLFLAADAQAVPDPSVVLGLMSLVSYGLLSQLRKLMVSA